MWYRPAFNNTCRSYSILHAVSNDAAHDRPDEMGLLVSFANHTNKIPEPGSRIRTLLTILPVRARARDVPPARMTRWPDTSHQLEYFYDRAAQVGSTNIPEDTETEAEYYCTSALSFMIVLFTMIIVYELCGDCRV